MACECEWTSQRCGNLVKISNIISGLFLIALGILRFIYNSQLTNFLQFLLSAYYMYHLYITKSFLTFIEYLQL